MRDSIIKQELKDFKEEVISRLQRIERQTTMTNGKVASAITDIALVNQKQISCPARIAAAIPTKFQIKDQIISIVAVLIALAAILLK